MNVDQSIRILQFVITDEYSKLSINEKLQYVDTFCNIPKQQKPTKYAKLTRSEVITLFDSLNLNFKKQIRKDLTNELPEDIEIFKGSNNNKQNADVYCYDALNRIINIELKFGKETLSNKGNAFMDELFNTAGNEEFNFSKMNREIIDYQISNINNQITNEEELINLLKKKLTEIVQQMQHTELKINNDVANKLLYTVGDSTNINDRLIKYYIYPNEILASEIIYSNYEWVIESVTLQKKSSRIEIRLSNSEDIVLIFLLNWKNSKTYKNKKYKAKTGISTSSWNVWINNKSNNKK